MMKMLKETMSSLLFEFSLMSEVWHYGVGIVKVIKVFKLQIISGVSCHTSCKQIFKDYSILTLSSLYILEVICVIKKYKNSMVRNMDIHDHNT
jgi:hypothetical protein